MQSICAFLAFFFLCPLLKYRSCKVWYMETGIRPPTPSLFLSLSFRLLTCFSSFHVSMPRRHVSVLSACYIYLRYIYITHSACTSPTSNWCTCLCTSLPFTHPSIALSVSISVCRWCHEQLLLLLLVDYSEAFLSLFFFFFIFILEVYWHYKSRAILTTQISCIGHHIKWVYYLLDAALEKCLQQLYVDLFIGSLSTSYSWDNTERFMYTQHRNKLSKNTYHLALT